MAGAGLALSMIQDNNLSSVKSTPQNPSVDYSGVAPIATAAVDVWATLAQARVDRQMQRDLARYNNSMRAIIQGVKQFTSDKNRIAMGDAYANSDMQIEIDRLRAEAQVQVQAGFLGASSSAKRAAMYDIDRNALTAKFNQANQFENALQQVQLNEYSDNMQQITSQQSGASNAPSALSVGLGAVLNLGTASVKSGAWDKGSKLRNTFGDLFSSSEARLPTD